MEIKVTDINSLDDLTKEISHALTQHDIAHEKELEAIRDLAIEDSLRILDDLVSHGYDNTQITAIACTLVARVVIKQIVNRPMNSVRSQSAEIASAALENFLAEAVVGKYKGPIDS